MQLAGFRGFETVFRWRSLSLIGVTALLVLTTGCPSAGTAPDEVEWFGERTLPRTFDKAWFRTDESPGLIRAYSKSGELVIGETGIRFTDGDEVLDIPFRDVTAVRRSMLGRDTVNVWAILDYRDGDEIETAAFVDGTGLGWGGVSDDIYLTLEYAAEVLNGVPPHATAPRDVAS